MVKQFLKRTQDTAVSYTHLDVYKRQGADVTYNIESGEIVIVSAGGLDSGVNYKLLFKYTEKEKIGNSKEHWRFTKTDNFDMSESSYGSSYRFSMNDISFTLRSQKNDGTSSLEQYYLCLLYTSRCV